MSRTIAAAALLTVAVLTIHIARDWPTGHGIVKIPVGSVTFCENGYSVIVSEGTEDAVISGVDVTCGR